MNYYEIYDRQTGELLARGNAKECRRMLGYSSVDSFYQMVKWIQKGRIKKYSVIKMKGGETDYPVLGEYDPLYRKQG